MVCKTFDFKDSDGVNIFVYKWIPEGEIKGIIQIAHGMAETAARYERFAGFLTGNGYLVFANDHRGHGKTAGSVEKLGYIADDDGFNWMVKDMHELNCSIRDEYKNMPVFLFGHSMGSFLSQRYIQLYGSDLSGVILSGTNGKQGSIIDIGILIAKFEMKRHGRREKSNRLNSMSFGAYNKAFKPCRTPFDWLGRDESEVDKYINDPYCGTVFTTSFYYDLFRGLKDLYKPDNLNGISKDLPIYIMAGEMDPVGNKGKGIIKLYNMYKNLNIKDVKYKLYKDGRHEMLNEINRDEVMRDIVTWFNNHI
ncbi:MAG: alpha/beta fold family hydrolase [Clostridiaceae bacterium]|nr:alpha/beta fold family hydrolase [Clostridiaceae bacterium]